MSGAEKWRRSGAVGVLGAGWIWLGVTVVRSPCREFHLDEGWELEKAWMLLQGYPMYGDFWNDQPPFYTLLLRGLLAVPGADMGWARGLTLGMATLLAGCFAWLVSRMAGFWGAVVGLVLLAASGQVLLQCGAVMIGLPAYALALASVVCVWRWREGGAGTFRAPGGADWSAVAELQNGEGGRAQRGPTGGVGGGGWLAGLSGVLAGLALQTKLTAGLVLLALGVQVLVWGWLARPGEERRAWGRAVGIWLAGLVGAWVAVGAVFPGMGAGMLVGGHFDDANAAGFAEARYQQLDRVLAGDWALWLGAVPGLLWCWLRRSQWGVFPVVLLLGSYFAHRLHRPFWFYYYLHLAVPLAWLAAVGLGKGAEWVVTRWAAAGATSGPSWRTSLAALGWSVAVTALVLTVPGRVVREAAFARNGSSPEVEALLGNLRARRGETRWFYTDRPALAFAARMVLPPELVVVPQKRVRTGRMTEARLVALLQRYRPEQMVVCGRELHGAAFAAFVAAAYHRESAAAGHEYFVRRDLAAKTGVAK